MKRIDTLESYAQTKEASPHARLIGDCPRLNLPRTNISGALCASAASDSFAALHGVPKCWNEFVRNSSGSVLLEAHEFLHAVMALPECAVLIEKV